MISNTRYSLARFSLNSSENEIPIEALFSEVMGSVAGVAVPVFVAVKFAENVSGSIQSTISIITELDGTGDMGAAVKMSANVVTELTASAAMSSSVSGVKDVSVSAEYSDELRGDVWGGKDIHTDFQAESGLGTVTHGSKDIVSAMMVSEALFTSAEGTKIKLETTRLEITIPPGGELRIDSEFYTVMLDGENALETQSGDWISIAPETLRLTVECAAGGGLSGSLSYTERYL